VRLSAAYCIHNSGQVLIQTYDESSAPRPPRPSTKRDKLPIIRCSYPGCHRFAIRTCHYWPYVPEAACKKHINSDPDVLTEDPKISPWGQGPKRRVLIDE
jgi:hypothetical protein